MNHEDRIPIPYNLLNPIPLPRQLTPPRAPPKLKAGAGGSASGRWGQATWSGMERSIDANIKHATSHHTQHSRLSGFPSTSKRRGPSGNFAGMRGSCADLELKALGNLRLR